MANSRQFMAARTGAWAKSGRVPTARDYPLDGCEFFLDGIENSGFGVHLDLNSTMVWKNLISGGLFSDVQMYGSFLTLDDAVKTSTNESGGTSDCYGSCSGSIMSGIRTIQFLLRNVTRSSILANGAWLFSDNKIPVCYLSYMDNFDGINFIRPSVYSTTYDAGIFGNPTSAEVSAENKSKYLTFSNSLYVGNGLITVICGGGIANDVSYINDFEGGKPPASRGSYGASAAFSGQFQLFNRTSDFKRPTKAEILRIQIFNRALSYEEVKRSYAIDKARFNLPDVA